MIVLAVAAAVAAAITPFASELVGAVAFVLAAFAVALVPRPAPAKKRRPAAKRGRRKRTPKERPAQARAAIPDAPPG